MDTNLNFPIIITRNIVVQETSTSYIDVGREISLNALENAIKNKTNIIIATQKDPDIEIPFFDDIYNFGALCEILNVKETEIGKRIKVKSIATVKIKELTDNDIFFGAKISQRILTTNTQVEKFNIAFAKLIAEINNDATLTSLSQNINKIVNEESKHSILNIIANSNLINENVYKKIEFLKISELYKKVEFLRMQIKTKKLGNQIEQELNQKLNQKMMESQREYHLREKMKLIKEELGEGDLKENYIIKINKELEKNNKIPKHIKEKIKNELTKFEISSSNSSDANVIRNYIDTLISLPFGKQTKDNNDLIKIREILDQDHYGMKKPKERIIEFLALKKWSKKDKGIIILLDGPPGVGKTSFAKSIAKALNRKFVKISLGGVKDEAEIRGHRRTYLGSNPGRIIQAIKKANVENPLFLLDEIDKMGYDYKGDPSDALLEVLDPEQNAHFSDHFIEEEFDLSKVLFIATSNDASQISRPLLDRMEVIRIDGYTSKEKVQIAKNHILKEITENLKISEDIKIDDDVLEYVIDNYTLESGVRSLKRVLERIIRKYLVESASIKNNKKITLNKSKIKSYLNRGIIRQFSNFKEDKIGIVLGLAYTSFGGDVLPIEVNFYKGEPKVILTGSLGDVMKESANIAVSYLKSNAKKLKIDPKFFEENTIHVHAPEGAIPKDGPSAGIALTSVIYSAISNKKIKKDYAMTGEITLRGDVLAIGGLKEKSAGAIRAGVKNIIIPKNNEKDVLEIPEEIVSKVNYIYVNNIDQVFKELLV